MLLAHIYPKYFGRMLSETNAQHDTRFELNVFVVGNNRFKAVRKHSRNYFNSLYLLEFCFLSDSIIIIFIDNQCKSTQIWFDASVELYLYNMVKKGVLVSKTVCELIYAQRIILIYSNHIQTLSNISRPFIYALPFEILSVWECSLLKLKSFCYSFIFMWHELHNWSFIPEHLTFILPTAFDSIHFYKLRLSNPVLERLRFHAKWNERIEWKRPDSIRTIQIESFQHLKSKTTGNRMQMILSNQNICGLV